MPFTGKRPIGVKELYFHTWSPSMAYDLGYCYADGTVVVRGNSGQLNLECETSDEELILGIRSRVNSHHHVKRRPARISNNRNRSPSTIIQITNTSLTRRLIQLGCVPNKSNLPQPYPLCVPGEYQPHFLRGYFDGDGTVGFSRRQLQWSLLGDEEFLLGAKRQLCSTLGIAQNTVRPVTSGTRTFIVTWSACEDLLKIIPWLYPEGEYPYLARKRLLMEEWLLLVDTSSN